jgi:hypothetical protein
MRQEFRRLSLALGAARERASLFAGASEVGSISTLSVWWYLPPLYCVLGSSARLTCDICAGGRQCKHTATRAEHSSSLKCSCKLPYLTLCWRQSGASQQLYSLQICKLFDVVGLAHTIPYSFCINLAAFVDGRRYEPGSGSGIKFDRSEAVV